MKAELIVKIIKKVENQYPNINRECLDNLIAVRKSLETPEKPVEAVKEESKSVLREEELNTLSRGDLCREYNIKFDPKSKKSDIITQILRENG